MSSGENPARIPHPTPEPPEKPDRVDKSNRHDQHKQPSRRSTRRGYFFEIKRTRTESPQVRN